jgi:hypothetical protein
VRAFEELTKSGASGACGCSLSTPSSDVARTRRGVPPAGDTGGQAAARSLNVIYLGLNPRRPGLPEFIDRHSALVAEWMTGLAQPATVI